MDDVDIGKTLQRAWDTVWRYKALWVFGAILALTAGGSAAPTYYGRPGPDVTYQMDPWQGVSADAVPAIIAVGVAVAVVLLALGVVAAIFRYVSETALIDMVDEYEASSARKTVGKGFRAGWSRSAWRLFLIDLLVGVPTFILVLLMFALAGAPALLWLTGSDTAGWIGTAVSVLAIIPAVLVAIAVSVVLSVLLQFFRRACVIERLGVTASIRRGVAVARRSWSNVTLTWLVMLGLSIGWGIARVVLFFVLLPVFFMTAVLGIVAGGVPTLVALGVASLASQAPPHWVPYLATAAVGIAIGLPLFVLVAGAPWFFINGLMQVFTSSVWTQVYRQLDGREPASDQVAEEAGELAAIAAEEELR